MTLPLDHYGRGGGGIQQRASVNTLRRSLDGYKHPGHQSNLVAVHFGLGVLMRILLKWAVVITLGIIFWVNVLPSDFISLNPAPVATQQTADAQSSDPLDGVKAFEIFFNEAESNFLIKKPGDVDLDTIRKTLVLIYGMVEQLDMARQKHASLSHEQANYLKQVEARLSVFQNRNLPGLRLAFCRRSANMLWENDIKVRCSGERNTSIAFTGTTFAVNRNKQQTQRQIGDNLEKLRFKASRYEWYSGGAGSTYHLNTPSDSAIQMFKFGAFQQLAPITAKQ